MDVHHLQQHSRRHLPRRCRCAVPLARHHWGTLPSPATLASSTPHAGTVMSMSSKLMSWSVANADLSLAVDGSRGAARGRAGWTASASGRPRSVDEFYLHGSQ